MDSDREQGFSERQEAAEMCQKGKVCPNCDGNGLESKGVETTQLEVTELGVKYLAPFNACLDCGFEYTDYEYEEAQDKALRSAGRIKQATLRRRVIPLDSTEERKHDDQL